MKMTKTVFEIYKRSLIYNYVEAVNIRNKNKQFRKLEIGDKIIYPIVANLVSRGEGAKFSCLAELFVKAQFTAMPLLWCQEHFKQRHPPIEVVFGGDCWSRYLQYLQRGRCDE